MATQLIIAALRRELMHLWGRLSGIERIRGVAAWRATLEGRPLLLLVSGMGEAAAHRAMDWALAQSPSRIVSIGFAGSLGKLRVGDPLIPGEITNESGHLIPLGGHGRLLTVRRLGPVSAIADAVDMESLHIVERCRAAHLPVSVIRAISDTADKPLSPHLAHALQGEQVRLSSLAWAILRRPWLIAELMRLARDSARAARTLAEAVVAEVLSIS